MSGHQSWTVRGRLVSGVGVSIAGFSLSLPWVGESVVVGHVLPSG